MKSVVSSVFAITFVVLATTSAFAAGEVDVAHKTPSTASMALSEADALRLALALKADQGDGH